MVNTLDNNASGKDAPILVTGAHRTGTTWVGKMLVAGPQVAYISEPLNVLHRPGVMRARVPHWYHYIAEPWDVPYLQALQETLAFRYHLGTELLSLHSLHDAGRMGRDLLIFLRGRLRRQRPLLKDPFAVFSIPWFVQRLGCRVVVTVRHPAGFASSLKRLDWPFDFRDLLAQPALMELLAEAGLATYRPEMERLAQLKATGQPDDILGQASLLWRLVYQVVDRYRQMCPDLLVVRHEDLSLDPVPGFRTLYQQMGLDFTSKVKQTILESSSSENPKELSNRKVHAVRLDSRANLYNWKKRLTAEEIQRIRDLTEDIAAIYYPDAGW